jgi:membrane protease YdiL (CAAX protease family)
LAATFAITWPSWWLLAAFADHGVTSYGRPTFMAPYVLGGFGPTIGAYLAVAATPAEGSLGEYHSRLFRWRVSPLWWLTALGLPFAMAGAAHFAATWMTPALATQTKIGPLIQLVTLFPTMIIGGGLEELGWRGVAQPELERRAPRLAATAVVAAAWTLWHVPLFFIAGVVQAHTAFAPWAIQLWTTAFVLAWLYANTRSILLCVTFHAALNSAFTLGFVIPPGLSGLTVWSIELVLAILLLASPFARGEKDSSVRVT